MASLVLLLCQPLHAGELPPAFTANYILKKFGATVAKATFELRYEDNRVIYESITKTTGMLSLIRNDVVTEYSVLEDTCPEPRLVEIFFEHQGGKPERNVHAFIDWNRKEASITRADKTEKRPITAPLWDPFSVKLALMRDAGKSDGPLEYTLLNRNKLEIYSFTTQGKESIKHQGKNLMTLKLEGKREESKRRTVVWLAPTMNYMPLRIEQYRDDKLDVAMELVDVRWN